MAVLCSVLPGTISVNPSSNLGREPLGSASFYRIRGIKNSSNLHTVTQLLSSWLVPTWTSTAKPCPMKLQSRGLIPVLGADGVMSTGENRQAQREPTHQVTASGLRRHACSHARSPIVCRWRLCTHTLPSVTKNARCLLASGSTLCPHGRVL